MGGTQMKGFGDGGQAPVGWWGRSTQAGPLWPVHHKARFSLSPPPIPTRAGPCGQSPFPSLPSQVCTGQRKGGDPGFKQAADTPFYLALRLSPLEKPTSSTPELESPSPLLCLLLWVRGLNVPGAKAGYTQQDKATGLFPARAGVVRPKPPGLQDVGDAGCARREPVGDVLGAQPLTSLITCRKPLRVGEERRTPTLDLVQVTHSRNKWCPSVTQSQGLGWQGEGTVGIIPGLW